MKNLRRLFLLIAITPLVYSCSVVDDDDDNTPTPTANGTNTDGIGDAPILLTDSQDLVMKIAGDNMKVWTTSRFTLSGSTLFTSCRLDDIMTFNRDGSYRYDGGSQLCGAEDNRRTRTGTWRSDFDNKLIIFDQGTSKEYTADIIGFSDSELRLRGAYMNMEVKGEYQAQ